MKLPNADQAVVEQKKVVDYLLNEAHPYGRSKARFFAEFGYGLERWYWPNPYARMVRHTR